MNNTHAIQSCTSVESQRASRTPQDILNAITAVYPCPAVSGFERAAWLYQTREAARWIDRIVSAEYKLQLAEIEYHGLTSDTYEIIPVERTESRVDGDRLRQKHPDIFADLVHIRASDAQKILGRRTLYELARDAIGDAAIHEYETINVGDLEQVMLPRLSAGFIDVGSKVVDWIVQEIEP